MIGIGRIRNIANIARHRVWISLPRCMGVPRPTQSGGSYGDAATSDVVYAERVSSLQSSLPIFSATGADSSRARGRLISCPRRGCTCGNWQEVNVCQYERCWSVRAAGVVQCRTLARRETDFDIPTPTRSQRIPQTFRSAPSRTRARSSDTREPAMVLVADADRDVSQLLAETLRRHGYRVTLACEQPESPDAWRAEPPDLVLLDPTMPCVRRLLFVSGLLQTLAAPVVLVSSDEVGEEALQWLDRGASESIAKPFSPAHLLARVDAILQREAADNAPESSSGQFENSVGRLASGYFVQE